MFLNFYKKNINKYFTSMVNVSYTRIISASVF